MDTVAPITDAQRSQGTEHAVAGASSEQRRLVGRSFAFRLVGILLGLLLLAAAYLKFRDLTWEPFGKVMIIPPRLRMIFIEAEALLGFWLLTGFAKRALWSVATLFFTALAGVSLYLANHGDPTCGCFGQATVSPWATLGIDVAAVVALVITRPCFRTAAGSVQSNDDGAGKRTVAIWACVTFVAVLAAHIVRFGGVEPAWEALTGRSVVVEPALAELGTATADEEVGFSVTIHNHASRPVQIIGGTNNCVGNANLDLPVTIPSGESRAVKVQGNFRGTPGRFVREYVFITDQDAVGVVAARFAGTILPTQ